MLADPVARLMAGGSGPLLRLCMGAPDDPVAWLALGQALGREGAWTDAEEAFATAAELAGDRLTALLQRVASALALDCGEAELRRLTSATEADPLDAAAWTALGVMLDRLARPAEAIEALEVAAALSPDEPRAARMLAALLARSPRLKDAEAALRTARALDPDDVSLANDLAVVLVRMYRFAEARAVLLDAVGRAESPTQELCNLAAATLALGLQAEAEETARLAVASAPELMQARRSLANVLPYRDGATAREVHEAVRASAALIPRPPAWRPANTRDPERRLRVGLLSGTMREHPVGWLTVAGFEALDPTAFELVAFGQAQAEDQIARRFRAACRQWHALDALDDEKLAALARALEVDVLIELGGHGEGGRLPACARRLAPVQVKWVGMQYHSTGMAEMDWFLTDRWETPPHLAEHYTERLLTLPDGYVCYSPPPDAPDVGPLPAAADGFVTFGCFNNLAKVTPRSIGTWSRVLRRVPGSRMILKTQALADADARARIHGAFAAHGIGAERLELRGGSPHRAFLGQYNDVDLVLDPFPYTGGLTTCEALWMGAPTVTLPGETFASRHSMSHMSNVGLADWVAEDADAYVDIAVARATDLHALAALRSGLRARVRASPLCDARRFGRGLGAALRHAWREWCAGQAA